MAAKTILYPVTDLKAATATFTALLGAPHADSPYYVGFEADGQEIGLVPNSDLTGPTPHFHVDDLEATIAALTEAGATVSSEPKAVGGGRRVAVLLDQDKNPIGLVHDA